MRVSVVSICTFCGAQKSKALDKCRECGAIPTSKKQCVESLIFCFDDAHVADNFLTKKEFQEKSESIRSGEKIQLDKHTLQAAEKQYKELSQVDGKMLIIYLIKLSLPLFIVIGLTIAIALL